MEKRKLIILALVPFLLFWHWYEPSARKNTKGIEQYKQKQYTEALKQFLSAKGLNKSQDIILNNTASTLYMKKQFAEALEEFKKINIKESKIPESDLLYNIGNSFYNLGQSAEKNSAVSPQKKENPMDFYKQALENYKQSILLNNSDLNARKNYELTQKKIKELENKNKQQNKDKDKDKKNQKKDKNKNQDKKNQDKQKKQNKKQQKKPSEKYKNLMKYLNQKEKKQIKKRKRTYGTAKKEKDW